LKSPFWWKNTIFSWSNIHEKQLNTYKKALVLLGFLRKLVFEVSSVGVLLAPQALEKERDQHAEAAKRHQERGMQWGFNHHEIMEAP